MLAAARPENLNLVHWPGGVKDRSKNAARGKRQIVRNIQALARPVKQRARRDSIKNAGGATDPL